MTLIKAKQNEYLVGLHIVDPRDQFENVTNCKWWKITYSMNANGHSLLPKNIITYKDKWGAIYEEFKRVFDDMASI
jgi:hypothetical protein